MSRCIDCVEGVQQESSESEEEYVPTCPKCHREFRNENELSQHMQTHRKQVCSQCRYSCEKSEFSSNQWRKGDGLGRCIDCVEGAQCDLPTCPQCRREFRTEHDLTQHMKVHRSRDVACPVCGDRRFASGANAVAHVESGFCTGCRGKDNARAAIHGFVAHNAPHLRNKMIGYDGNYSSDVPDLPYACTYCRKAFGSLSSMMNHEEDVHRNVRSTQQIGWH